MLSNEDHSLKVLFYLVHNDMAYNITLKQKQTKKSNNARFRVPTQAGAQQVNNSLRNRKLVTGPPCAVVQLYVVYVNGTF